MVSKLFLSTWSQNFNRLLMTINWSLLHFLNLPQFKYPSPHSCMNYTQMTMMNMCKITPATILSQLDPCQVLSTSPAKRRKKIYFISHHSSFIFYYRWILMPQGGFAIQARIFILLDSNLYAMLYVGYRIMGIILAWSRCCTGSSVSRCHYTSHNGHSNVGYKCFTSSRIIHKSHWCVDGSVSDVRIWSATRICTCQLCITLRLVDRINMRLTLIYFAIEDEFSSWLLMSFENSLKN